MATDLGDRLTKARENAGFEDATAAAAALDVNRNSYIQHENGTRGFKRDRAELYARRFRVSLEWLLTGKGPMRPKDKRLAKLVGYVGAGAAMNLYRDGHEPDEWVEAPDGSTADTVAVEIKGESLGPLFDRWLVFYDDRRDPVTRDMIGKLCILGLADGRVLIKKLAKGGIAGYWTLLSNFEPPIYDVAVEWGAVVKAMVPRT